MAGVSYTCRVCGDEKTVYVSPKEIGDDLVVDLNSYHRLYHDDCRTCEESRTWVASRTLSSFEEGTDVE